MKLLIEIPTWLGDAVMTTPALENIIQHYPNSEISLIGSYDSIQALRHHPQIHMSHVMDKNLPNAIRIIRSFEQFDVFFSFRRSLRAQITKLFVPARKKFQFDHKEYTNRHQVEKYNCFVNESIGINSFPNKLILYQESANKNKNKNKNKLLGINPGASYGSAKRWHPKKFADVAVELSSKYDIIIFGGNSEKKFALDIEKNLIDKEINNYQNLAGKTKLSELIYLISGLDLFLTGDSGPMHIAAAMDIPTISIFGPTDDRETSQWMNNRSVIIKKNLNCQPCMKRSCPLKHHKCMNLIEPYDVINEAKRLV